MLQQLHIHNYAIIDTIQINFSNHLNIITGETGAGKSILMGALSLILGERADTSVLLDKEKKCFIEGGFKTNQTAVADFFQKMDLDYEEEILIRREISANGKSRAFINDTPVTLAQLKQLTSLLVDLHQQFDTLELNNNDFQRQVIDALANNGKLLEQYQTIYKSYFQMEESDQPIVQQIKSITYKLQSLENIFPETEILNARLQSLQIDLQDISGEIDGLNNKVNFDAEKINNLNERMSHAYTLLKKHNVQTTAELQEIKNELSIKLEKINNLSELITEKEKQSFQYYKEAIIFAQKISQKRIKEIAPFEEKVNQLLKQVGMPNARIKIEITEVENLNLFGSNIIEFLFNANVSSANKSAKFDPLRKVASGGELSRLMLSIKSLVAKSVQLPTLIFDEIDSGISGEAAKQVGKIIKELSLAHQVISITHQPQIAAIADKHFFVYKEIKEEAIITAIKTLNADERITAIATMLSGKKPTAAAFENAKEMMGN